MPKTKTTLPVPSDNGSFGPLALQPDEAFHPAINEEKMHVLREIGAMAMVALGQRLGWHKEHVEHGDWIAVVNRLGIGLRTAQKHMLVAKKFEARNAPARAHLGIRQAYELAEELTDEELDELEATEQVRDLKLDDIATMTVRELRDTLRKSRQHNKKLSEAREEVKTLKAENAALKQQGGPVSPTVENARKLSAAFSRCVDEGCRHLSRIMMPDPESAEGEAEIQRVIAKIEGALVEAERQLQGMRDLKVVPFLAE